VLAILRPRPFDIFLTDRPVGSYTS
jgi:hypothetical protein